MSLTDIKKYLGNTDAQPSDQPKKVKSNLNDIQSYLSQPDEPAKKLSGSSGSWEGPSIGKQLLNLPGAIGRGIVAGTDEMTSGLTQLLKYQSQLGQKVFPDSNPITKPINRLYKLEEGLTQKAHDYAQNEAENYSQPMNGAGEIEKGAFNVSRGLPLMGTALSTGPFAPVVFGGVSAGNSASEAEQSGATLPQQLTHGSVVGIVNGLTSMPMLGNLSKTFTAPAKQALAHYLLSIPEAGLQGTVASIADGLSKQFVYQPDQFVTDGQIDWEKVKQAGIEAGKIGLTSAGTAATLGLPGAIRGATSHNVEPQVVPEKVSPVEAEISRLKEEVAPEQPIINEPIVSSGKGTDTLKAIEKYLNKDKVSNQSGEVQSITNNAPFEYEGKALGEENKNIPVKDLMQVSDKAKKFAHPASLKYFDMSTKLGDLSKEELADLYTKSTDMSASKSPDISKIGTSMRNIAWIEYNRRVSLSNKVANQNGEVQPGQEGRQVEPTPIKSNPIDMRNYEKVTNLKPTGTEGIVENQYKPSQLSDIILSKINGKEVINGEGNPVSNQKNTGASTAENLYPDNNGVNSTGKNTKTIKSQPIIDKAGFSNLEEAHVAVEANKKGLSWFKRTFPELTEADYKGLTEKLNNLNSGEQGRLKIDLQLFAMRDPKFTDNAKSKVNSDLLSSRFRSNTLERSTAIPDEIKAKLNPEEFDYIPETSKQWQDNAVKNIQENRDKVVNDIIGAPSISGGIQAHEAAVISSQLIEEAKQSGNYDAVKAWTKIVAEKTRETARALKGTDTAWEKTKSVEGAISKAQRVINNAKEMMKQFRIKGKQPELTDDDIMQIVDGMEKAKAYPDGSNEQVVEIAKVKRLIAAKLPVSLGEKISAYQTIAQLLNPKTMIRNVFGNIGFQPAEQVSGILGTAVDKLTSLYTGKRTKLMPNLQAEVKGFFKGATGAYKDYRADIDTSPDMTQFDLPRKRIFKNVVMKELEKATGFGLKLGDRPFYQAAFEGSLAEQMKLSGVKEPTKEMIDSAHEVAKYRTFQDENVISNLFSRLKHTLNFKNGKLAGTGFGDIVLKYPKTPANLLARAIDYSPVGYINSLNELYKGISRGEFNQRKFVDSISRATVGTGMFMAGVSLYNLGIVSGKSDSDKDVNALQQATGLGMYKINLSALYRFLTTFNPKAAQLKAGDKFMSYDWIQPMAIPVSMGVNMSAALKNKKRIKAFDAIGAVVTSLEGSIGTLAEQPLVSGIANLFKGFSSDDIVDNLIQSAASAPSSFIPTLLNQIKQISDNTKRNVQGNNSIETGINLVKNKVPGLSSTLPKKVNTLGKTQTTYQDNNFINVLLNPAFTSEFDKNPAAKLVLDIYNRTGEKEHFPRVAPKYITYNKKKISLTPQQQNEIQETMGKDVSARFAALAKDSGFNNSSDEKKIERMKHILDLVGSNARFKYIQAHLKELKATR